MQCRQTSDLSSSLQGLMRGALAVVQLVGRRSILEGGDDHFATL